MGGCGAAREARPQSPISRRSRADPPPQALAFCVLSWASDAPSSSLVHLCVLTLLVISAEPGFGAAAQAPCPHSLPLRGRAARATSASLADLVVGAAAEVLC